jgi:hypothetical protein
MSSTVTETPASVSPLKVKVQPSSRDDSAPATSPGHGVGVVDITSQNASTFQDQGVPPPGVAMDPELAKKSEQKFDDVPFSRPFSPKQPSEQGAPESSSRSNGLHTAIQMPDSATSAALEASEAGHARRWIRVPKGWYAKEGAEVVDGLCVGDALGKGCQVMGHIYESDGSMSSTMSFKSLACKRHLFGDTLSIPREALNSTSWLY